SVPPAVASDEIVAQSAISRTAYRAGSDVPSGSSWRLELDDETAAGPGRRIVRPRLAHPPHAVHLEANPMLVAPIGPERVPGPDGEDAGEDRVEQEPGRPVVLRVEVEVQQDQRTENGGRHLERPATGDLGGRADAKLVLR